MTKKVIRSGGKNKVHPGENPGYACDPVVTSTCQYLSIDLRHNVTLCTYRLYLSLSGSESFFSHRPLHCKVMTFFSCRLVTTHTFRRRFSSVLSKLSHNFFYFIRVSLPGWFTRGGPPFPQW